MTTQYYSTVDMALVFSILELSDNFPTVLREWKLIKLDIEIKQLF